MTLVRRVPTELYAALTLTGPTTACGSWVALDGCGEEGAVLETHALVGLNVRSEATLNGHHGVLHMTIVGRVAPGRAAQLHLTGHWELQGDGAYGYATASGCAAGAVDLKLGAFELRLGETPAGIADAADRDGSVGARRDLVQG